jgi:hypothetical protein
MRRSLLLPAAAAASAHAADVIGQADASQCRLASLLGSENSWINAQRIEVSGGMFL